MYICHINWMEKHKIPIIFRTLQTMSISFPDLDLWTNRGPKDELKDIYYSSNNLPALYKLVWDFAYVGRQHAMGDFLPATGRLLTL